MLPLVAAFVLGARRGVADPPASAGKAGKVIILADEGWLRRPSSYVTSFQRVVLGARSSLARCHELAIAQDPNVNAEISAAIAIGPNGEVQSVSLVTTAPVDPGALACFRRRLVNVVFDAPGGPGVTLRVAFILGEPASTARPALGLALQPDVAMPVVGPLVMRFNVTRPPPEVRGVRLAADALATCAKATVPAGPIVVDVRLLVADSGTLARLEATSATPGSEALVRCVAQLAWSPASGHVSRVELRLSVAPNGEVSVAP